jgi:hypothetical protein
MKSRSAERTLLGFYYQFDKTIQTILEQSDENSVITVEGIEDIDTKTATEETAIQIKYQAETDGTDSVLRKPIMLMLEHFKNNQSKNLTYHLYGHYKDNSKVNTTFDFIRIQTMMVYTESKMRHDFLQEKNISQYEVNKFLKKFNFSLSKSFDGHQQETFAKIKSEMNVSTEEEVNFFYSNALKIVNDLAIQKNITKRKITKKDFINSIDTKDTLFTIWFLELKGIEKYCKATHKKHFKSALNGTIKERFFIVPNDSIVNLKNVIYAIEEKFYKTTNRGITSGAPYIMVNGISKQDLIDLKKLIYSESKTISDGIPFLGADFQAKEILKPSTKENSVSIKILSNINELNEVVAKIATTKEIFQFYIEKKEALNIIGNIHIQIENFQNIRQIIKG